MNFIVLSSLETVHDTVQYRYCIVSLLYRLLRIRLNRQNPLLSDVRETERERERKRDREREKKYTQMYNVVYSTLYFYFI